MAVSSSQSETFLRLPQVLERIPVSRSGWYMGIKEGRFPPGRKLGLRMVAWRKSDIDALIEQLAAGQ